MDRRKSNQIQPRTWVLGFLIIAASECAQGNIECEDLPVEDCAFAVSSSGARCVLEKYVKKDGITQLECQTSMIMAERKVEWIETSECISSCGLSRMTVGLSTDSLLDKEFTMKLCSPECQDNCPNVIDLYIKLAAGDGLYLPHLCKLQAIKSRRLSLSPIRDPKTKDTASRDENALSSSWTFHKDQGSPVDEHLHYLAVHEASAPSGSSTQGGHNENYEKDWRSPALLAPTSPTPVKSKLKADKPLPTNPSPMIQPQPVSTPVSSPMVEDWASSFFEI